MQPILVSCLALVAVAGCVADKPIGPGQRCPCAPGWSCEPTAQVCVVADAAVTVPDAPVVDADAPVVAMDTVVADPMDTMATDIAPITCASVSYPIYGFYGTNALHLDAVSFVSYPSPAMSSYELAADLAAGTTVTVKITMTAETLKAWRASAGLDGFGTGVWLLSDGQGWLISTFNRDTGEQVFLSQSGVLRPERQIAFQGSGEAQVDYYECNSPTPTRSKIIRWRPAQEPGDAGEVIDSRGDTRG